MQVKEIKPINFIYYRTEATLAKLADFVPKAKEVYREAINQDLHITGPVHWHYHGFSTEQNRIFTLEIALPVSEVPIGYDGPFHFKRTQPFKCVSVVHEGGWDELASMYNKVMQFMSKYRLEPSAINREIYVNADFRDPDANVTEIQVGIS